MATTREQLQKLADLKIKARRTDADAADYFGVSQRTIQRWLGSTAYGEIAQGLRVDQLDLARTHVAGMADEIVLTLRSLMQSSGSDMVRMQSAATLGKWLGLDEMKENAKGDDKNEIRELLQRIASKHEPPKFLPPPLPGGGLPMLEAPVEAEFFVEDDQTQEKEM